MKGSPSGMTPNALHFYDFDVFDIFPLAPQPHFDALPVDFRFQLVRPVIFTQYLRRRQTNARISSISRWILRSFTPYCWAAAGF